MAKKKAIKGQPGKFEPGVQPPDGEEHGVWEALWNNGITMTPDHQKEKDPDSDKMDGVFRCLSADLLLGELHFEEEQGVGNKSAAQVLVKGSDGKKILGMISQLLKCDPNELIFHLTTKLFN